MVKSRICLTISDELKQDIDKHFNNIEDVSNRFWGYKNITSKSQFVEIALRRELDKL